MDNWPSNLTRKTVIGFFIPHVSGTFETPYILVAISTSEPPQHLSNYFHIVSRLHLLSSRPLFLGTLHRNLLTFFGHILMNFRIFDT
jgi:hypothetical protein